MSTSPYVNFYTSDFLAGTSGMTAASKGVYITLLCLMYEAEAPLTQNWDTLARRCGCTKSSFKKAIEALSDDGKIAVGDDGLWSQKVEKHIALRRERSSSASAAGKKRWEKTKQKQGEDDTTASSALCQPEPEPELKEEAKASSQKNRGSRLPGDWCLPKDWGQWAVSQGYPEAAVRHEAEKFRDYWHSVAGQKGVKRDWLATWRNWIRNSSTPKLSTISGGQAHAKPSSQSHKRQSAFIAGARGAP